jgi:hypothetical protein
VPVAAAGESTNPTRGQKVIAEMARAIGEWVKNR